MRALWDFDDLDASEDRFRTQLAEETTEHGRAEVLTQLARIEGLRGSFDEGERLIEEAEAHAGTNERARARIDLERGRLRRSSGNVEAALPLFESAFAIALDAGWRSLAADAAHMAALAAPDRGGFDAWTTRGIEVAQSGDASARYWLGPLLNNLGWERYEAEEYDEALETFTRALEERNRDPGNPAAIALARYAVGKTLRALGRPGDAVPLLEQAVAWAEDTGRPDGWFHEELADEYAALGLELDAREHARLALELHADGDPSLAGDPQRLARLHGLAAEP